MSNELAKQQQVSAEQVQQLINTSLKRVSAETLKSYSYALKVFAEFLGKEDSADALQYLLSQDRGTANYCILQFVSYLEDQGMSASTINARVAAIKGRVSDAQMIGLVSWSIDVKSPKRDPVKNVVGPTPKQFRRIVRYVSGPSTIIDYRNRAIIYMLSFMALRRNEIASLDLQHVDFHRKRIHVLRKGKRDRSWISVPTLTMSALREWVRMARIENGPLFVNFDKSKKGGGRLSVSSIYRMVKKIGEDCGIPDLHPHAFRHFAITEALELTDGNTRKAQKLSGHTDPRMLDVYEDERVDDALVVAQEIETKWIG
jgi:integrase